MAAQLVWDSAVPAWNPDQNACIAWKTEAGECEHLDYSYDGERRCWEIFNYELHHRGKSGCCQCFPVEGPRPVMVSCTRAGFTLNIIDTPGLVEEGYVNDQALELIKRFLVNKTIDVLLYVDRLDAYRVDRLDRQVVRAISDSFGKEIWRRGLVVLTHAQLSPPDGLSYEDFLSRRSEAFLKVVRLGARIKKQNIQVLLGTDSHTCTAGAFGQFSTGIGNTDAGFVLGTGKLLLKAPPTLRFVLDGEMPSYLLAKDLILQDLPRPGATPTR